MMDIFNAEYKKVGHMDGNDILNAEYKKIGHVDDNDIFNVNYKKIGYVDGDDIFNADYKKIGYADGNNIFNANYKKIGYVDAKGTNAQMGAAGMFLMGYFQKIEEPGGCLSKIIGAIIAMVMYSWPGRIGVAYGLAFGILGTIMQRGGIGIGIFLSIVLMLICGPLGLLAGFISSKLSRHGNLGALIGAAATGTVLAVAAAINRQRLHEILLFVLFGAVPGLVAGAIIGSIVGLVKKQIDKKK
jgi:hypothetical protein